MNDGLVFDHEAHAYSFDGQPIGGVSEILSALGLVERSHFTDFARDRGVAVHAAIEYHLCGDLDWSTVDPRIKGFVEGALRFLSDAKIERGPQTIVERPLYHPHWKYAGTPDLVSVAFGDPSVTDFKTGGLGLAGVQTALYEMAARVAFPIAAPLRRRMAVQLFEDGTYKKQDLLDGWDYAHAQQAVALYNAFVLPRRIRRAANAAA